MPLRIRKIAASFQINFISSDQLYKFDSMDPIEQILWCLSELIKLTSNEASIFQILSGIFSYERCSTQLVWVFFVLYLMMFGRTSIHVNLIFWYWDSDCWLKSFNFPSEAWFPKTIVYSQRIKYINHNF